MARLLHRRPPGSGASVRGTEASAAAVAPAPHSLADRVLITLSGIRQPIVAILLLISFFTVISGKPLDGLLLCTVATALAWDAGMQSRRPAAVSPAPMGSGALAVDSQERHGDHLLLAESAGHLLARPAVPATAAEPPASVPTAPTAWRLRSGPPRLSAMAIGSVAAVIYALTVGSFARYSWPTTAGVVGLGASVVVVGWGGPTRRRVIPGRFPRAAVLTWGSLLVAAGLWELIALLQQPNIETSSYAHPTISTLTDPLLSTAPGRSVALLGWIALGAYLVER
jgi:hypothetical protein